MKKNTIFYKIQFLKYKFFRNKKWTHHNFTTSQPHNLTALRMMEGEKYGMVLTPTQKAFVEDRRMGPVAWYDTSRTGEVNSMGPGQSTALAMIAADCMLSTEYPTHVVVGICQHSRRDEFIDRVVSMITPLLGENNAEIVSWDTIQSRLEVCICNKETGVTLNSIECIRHNRKEHNLMDLGERWRTWFLMDVTRVPEEEWRFTNTLADIGKEKMFHYIRTITDKELLASSLSPIEDRLYRTPNDTEKVVLFRDSPSLKDALLSLGIPF